jgi:rod shape-determining protein MreD
MTNWLSLPVLTLAAVLQFTFVPYIRILDGAPDLVFLFVIAWTVHARLETGITWAFVGGIVRDLLSAAPLGATTLGLILIVFTLKLVEQQFYGVTFLVISITVLVGTVLHYIVFGMVVGLVGFEILRPENFTFAVMPTVAYNLVAIGPVYWLSRRLQKRIQRDERVFW